MLRILILVLFLRLSHATLSSEVTSYARISRNGQPGSSFHDSLSWITRPVTRNDTSVESENRSLNDVVVTASPVYVAPKTPKLKKGEAIDYPVGSRYSTLDREMIAKLDASKKRIQQRFNVPAAGLFIKDSYVPANGRPQKGASTSNAESSPSINSSAFSGQIFPGIYEYSPTNPDSDDDDESPMSKPIISKYPPAPMDEIPDSYKPPPNKYHASGEHEMDYPNFEITSSYENNGPGSKPAKFANHHDHSSSFIEDPYEHDHHDFHHDVIYDHIPVYHEHHPTTEEPEMNDQRLDKRPYSYYFIGKKLWYIPLYFSIYLIIYIAALVLKSVARHKINLPTRLDEAVHHRDRRESSEGWWYFTERILEGIERFAETRLVCKFVLLSICIYHASGDMSLENAEGLISKTETSTENLELATIPQSIRSRRNRAHRWDYNTRGDNTDHQTHDHDEDINDDEHDQTKAMDRPKTDYWVGYYDFLINEGSYKFWAVFQLATAALLVYSAFAALYYAKVNPQTTDDYFDDIFRRRRRRRRSLPLEARDRPFAGLDTVTFQRIIEAVERAR
ncbi:hypothetical protein ALC62_00625 [Cyphomyrmex costatus]|uniref:Uncharacterized protein n=2 Tax=Cyphomyrmex costatus TaxID=456900 RepID=A0A151IQ94_9HYME|nr:hypothetical protein ALC62_00625 [Cyphomyrmex costatus]